MDKRYPRGYTTVECSFRKVPSLGTQAIYNKPVWSMAGKGTLSLSPMSSLGSTLLLQYDNGRSNSSSKQHQTYVGPKQHCL